MDCRKLGQETGLRQGDASQSQDGHLGGVARNGKEAGCPYLLFPQIVYQQEEAGVGTV